MCIRDRQRYVPMDISLTELIRAYLSIVPQREYLFVNSTSGRRYSAEWARKRMGHLLQDCGIDFERVRKYERGPCLHCFRHTFVAKAFDQLLQTPLDFADAVPFISTYLGHCDLRETDKYLQANYDFFQRDHTLITDYTRTVSYTHLSTDKQQPDLRRASSSSAGISERSWS